ncbi:MAG: glycosyltransferase [Chitinophagaceae bacterium]
MKSLLEILWIVVQVLVGYHLVLPLLMYLIYWFVPKKYQHLPQGNFGDNAEPDYAIIVTAYQQTDNLPVVVNKLLEQTYTNYLIYVVADNCDITNLHFASDKVILLRPEQVLAGNTKSHFYAIQRFKRNHSHITIIDSDNITHPHYLAELNKLFAKGFSAVQGIRNPKNLNTTYACLDAARDIYYHFYDGKVLFALGSSATLAGSGMAFTVRLYRDCLENNPISGAGFDKVLQYEILKRGYRIAFTEDAEVLDEKTSKTDQLVNQRARWINTWFKYCKFGLFLLLKGITRFNINQILFGVVLLRPPLFIFLLLGMVFMFVNIFLQPLAALIWALGFAAFVLGFMVSLWSSNTPKVVYESLINIPKFMYYQVISLLHARNANKRSVATVHSAPPVSDNLTVNDTTPKS